jgi:hypothetical protein
MLAFVQTKSPRLNCSGIGRACAPVVFPMETKIFTKTLVDMVLSPLDLAGFFGFLFFVILFCE